jgi:hypothetical protein
MPNIVSNNEFVLTPGDNYESVMRYLLAVRNYIAKQKAPYGFRQNIHGDDKRPVFGKPKQPALVDASYEWFGRPRVSVAWPNFIKLKGWDMYAAISKVLEANGISYKVGHGKYGYDRVGQTEYVEFDVSKEDYLKARAIISDLVHKGTLPDLSAKAPTTSQSDLIAQKRWKAMITSYDETVMRADASHMSPSQRYALVEQLKARGIHADIVYSQTYKRDYIQVGENDFEKLAEAIKDGAKGGLLKGLLGRFFPIIAPVVVGAAVLASGGTAKAATQAATNTAIPIDDLKNAKTPTDKMLAGQSVAAGALGLVGLAGMGTGVTEFAGGLGLTASVLRDVAYQIGLSENPGLLTSIAHQQADFDKVFRAGQGLQLALSPLSSVAHFLTHNHTIVGNKNISEATGQAISDFSDLRFKSSQDRLTQGSQFAHQLAKILRERGPEGDATRLALAEQMKKAGVTPEQYANALDQYATRLDALNDFVKKNEGKMPPAEYAQALQQQVAALQGGQSPNVASASAVGSPKISSQQTGQETSASSNTVAGRGAMRRVVTSSIPPTIHPSPPASQSAQSTTTAATNGKTQTAATPPRKNVDGLQAHA